MPKSHSESDAPTRRARLFRNGRNQALRIPREFELSCQDVIVRKDGDRLIIEPATKGDRLIETIRRLKPVEEPFPDVEEGLGPIEPVTL